MRLLFAACFIAHLLILIAGRGANGNQTPIYCAKLEKKLDNLIALVKKIAPPSPTPPGKLVQS